MDWWMIFDILNVILLGLVVFVAFDRQRQLINHFNKQILEEHNAAYLKGVNDGRAIWRNEDELRLALRNLKAVQAGWAFGVPEDGREQWLDMVIETVRR